MGRRVRTRSNPALASPHAAGSKVKRLQLLVHDRYGAIAYEYQRFWIYHYQLAEAAAELLAELHERVLAIDPGPHRMRMVADKDLLIETYAICNSLVSHAVRAVQHMAEEIERACGQELVGARAAERILEAGRLFSTEDWSADSDYSGLGEMVGVRDALEHPHSENVEGSADDWCAVPLAWALSNRSTDAWLRFDRWFGRLATQWEEYRSGLPLKRYDVQVQRGIESEMAVKNPPTAR